MKTLFVSRHAGALEWARQQGHSDAIETTHLDIAQIEPGDLVLGTLPVHIAADVCARGGRYLHLAMEIPKERRGDELSADDMTQFGARLEEFRIQRV